MSYYHRDLPHWQPEGAALFVTWRLHGSKPRDCDAPKGVKLAPSQAFILDDREWDRAAPGRRWLSNPRIAQCIVDTLRYGEENLKLYTLRAWLILCNHVHILIYPNAPLPRITKSIKNYSARRANAILGRTGPFWLEESYDRWVRAEDELNKIVQYIEGNPVAVDLCGKPEGWRWSSARAGREACATCPAPRDEKAIQI
jgi:REP element-mobilizing transposase RayT